MAEPKSILVVGAGHRSRSYAEAAVSAPDAARIVAVAEPDASRREHFAARHNIPPQMQFASWEELADRPAVADAAINGTMDEVHYASTVALLEAGYHVLLEKPIARTLEEVLSLGQLAERHKRILMICHVLRYAPFYRRIKQIVNEGVIGQIQSISTVEQVAYYHFATAFVRGKWNRAEINPVLLAKCCHDLDLISWFLSGEQVQRVSSFGSRTFYRPENAPTGATARCLDGCPVEESCAFSARPMYVEQNVLPFYPFYAMNDPRKASDEEKLASLRDPANPYGRCVWQCDNDVVDHQNVLIEFANGVTATHDLVGTAARGTRTIYMVGTQGEITGDFDAGDVTVRTYNLAAEQGFHDTHHVNVKHEGSEIGGGHGGGDARLVHDFVTILHGKEASESYTHIGDSLNSHLIAFAADVAMNDHRVVEADELLSTPAGT